ncbi:MAG TPA: 4'-phosphopantetheinyl transferase superfamily protein [Burkholderiales bacterium]|jgi:4'-phosphopantetheinyl transferase|nr:4'-phosphopantetheinyl transferase superfamily protein [Burkholderiales bacterium]
MAQNSESGSLRFSTAAPLSPETVAPFAADAVEVVVSRLDLEADAFNVLAQWLRNDELQRASRFQFTRDRRRFIVARGCLRQLLAARLGIDPQAVELSYGPNGKPVLAGGSAAMDWRFNISHSEDVAVFAFCRGREVGVDIEAVHSVKNSDAIASQFFSPGELAAYRALAPHEKDIGFFNCWTRKEAFVKALGGRLDFPLNEFDVSLSPDEPARIIRVGNIAGDDSEWLVRSFAPMPGYVAAVVVQRSRAAANDDAFMKGPACTLWTH